MLTMQGLMIRNAKRNDIEPMFRFITEIVMVLFSFLSARTLKILWFRQMSVNHSVINCHTSFYFVRIFQFLYASRPERSRTSRRTDFITMIGKPTLYTLVISLLLFFECASLGISFCGYVPLVCLFVLSFITAKSFCALGRFISDSLAVFAIGLIAVSARSVLIKIRDRLEVFAFETSLGYHDFRHFCSSLTKVFRTACRATYPLGSLHFRLIPCGGQY